MVGKVNSKGLWKRKSQEQESAPENRNAVELFQAFSVVCYLSAEFLGGAMMEKYEWQHLDGYVSSYILSVAIVWCNGGGIYIAPSILFFSLCFYNILWVYGICLFSLLHQEHLTNQCCYYLHSLKTILILYNCETIGSRLLRILSSWK